MEPENETEVGKALRELQEAIRVELIDRRGWQFFFGVWVGFAIAAVLTWLGLWHL